MAGRIFKMAMTFIGAVAMTGCGSAFTGTVIGVGNTGNVPEQVSFNVLGTPGTPFFATISDPNVSWTIQGVVPMSVVLINNANPVRMVATKLTSGPNLLSIQILQGSQVVQFGSSIAPFGQADVQLGGSLPKFSQPADPDVRFFVKGSPGETINGVIEDLSKAFIVQQIVPVLYLFENPDGRVDGQFNQVTSTGPMIIDLQFGHPSTNAGGPSPIVLSMTGAPHLVLKQP